MDDCMHKVVRALAEFLLLALVTTAVPLIVYIDSSVLENWVSEQSITEITQETLLFLSALLFWREGWRRPRSRGFLVLVGGLLTCMLVRELDFAFDTILYGSWVYVAALIAVVSVALAVMSRRTLFSAMAAYTGAKSCIYLSIGLLIALVFSRIFGSGRLNCIGFIGANCRNLYKTMIQEGLELLGYVFVFYASCLMPRER